MNTVMKKALIISTLAITSITLCKEPYEKVIEKYKNGTLSAQDVQTYTHHRVLERFKKRLQEKTKQPYLDFFGIHLTQNNTLTARRSIPNDETICNLDIRYKRLHMCTTVLQNFLQKIGFIIKEAETFCTCLDTYGTKKLEKSIQHSAQETKEETRTSLTLKINRYLSQLFPQSYAKHKSCLQKIDFDTLFILNRLTEKNIVYIARHIKDIYAKLTTNTIDDIMPFVFYQTTNQNDIFAEDPQCEGYEENRKIYLKNKQKKTHKHAFYFLMVIEHEITHYEQFLNKKAQQTINPQFPTITSMELPDAYACELDADIESSIHFPCAKLLAHETEKLINTKNYKTDFPYVPIAMVYYTALCRLGKEIQDPETVNYVDSLMNQQQDWIDEQKETRLYKKEYRHYVKDIVPQLLFNQEALERIITRTDLDSQKA